MFIRKVYNLASALRRQYKPLSFLKNYQNKLIRNLVRYAYRNNKFYHDLYKKNNIKISKIRSFDDLVKLPVVHKNDLQKYYSDFYNSTKDKYLQNTFYKNGILRRTGGSTGKPLFVYFNESAWDFSEAIYARSLLGAGYKPYEPMVVSNPFLIPKKRWFNYFGFFRKVHIPMDIDNTEQLKILRQRRKSFTLYSYPTLLRILSTMLDSNKPKINRIISTGELLTEKNRKDIESAFECPVYNHYGSMECNRIAWECEKKEGIHMDIDSLAIEFVKENQHVDYGEKGEIFLTNLHNYSFPLIRYHQGDFAVKIEDRCSCGRTLPLIKELLGRDNDFLFLDKDSRISPIPIDVALSEFSSILQYKLIQRNLNKFDLLLVQSKNFTDSTKDRINHDLSRLLRNPDIKINFKLVDKIPRSSGGKLRSIVCDIN